MKRKTGITIIILAVMVLLFSGCTSFFNDYEKYSSALSTHSTNEQTRIAAQANAIAETARASTSDNETVNALTTVIAMMQIEKLQPVPLGIERPTTGFDVLKAGVGHIPFLATTYSMLRLGEAGLDAAGNVSIGEGVNIDNGLNDTELHATGYSNMTYQGAADPTVVEVPVPAQ